jgi:hypothetical protein
MNPRPVFDVFLSHRPQDAGLAAFVAEELREHGLEVFHGGVVTVATEAVVDDLRWTIAECAAVVILVTPGYLKSPNLAFLAGAAMAWDKPIYVLYDGLELADLPDFLGQYTVSPITATRQVAEEIRQAQAPLSPEQQDALKEAYVELGVPADQLLVRASARYELGRRFTEKTRLKVEAERLVRELLNKRKRGLLPKLSPVRAAESA